MAKYYAVKKGRIPGIYTTWSECSAQVDGYSGAEYKSFTKKSEAKEYLGIEIKNKPTPPPPNTRQGAALIETVQTDCTAAAYVDGSYSVTTGEYAFGAVIFYGDKMYTFSHKYPADDLAAMRNVAGEIAGASFAMKYALQQGWDSIEIFYDYAGIECWATGAWRANLKGTKNYVKLYKLISPHLKVKFTKVKGHSGDLYNDFADRLAKDELSIK